MKTILITWTSWFIGFHLARKLINEWHIVIWVDNENDYYDIHLKEERRNKLTWHFNFKFYKYDLLDLNKLEEIFKENQIDLVINLAAQAWVRYSLENPFAYIQSNIVWFHNILYLTNKYNIKKFIYSSSSSVYWNNWHNWWASSTLNFTDKPISLYAATKKSNELIAHSYSYNYWISTIWLRFFTVYWPWWRPDMAISTFINKIYNWEQINIFNKWDMKRDFTYIDDIVDWIEKCINYDSNYEIFNLWCWNPVWIEYIVKLIEKWLWKNAIKNYLDLQNWDVIETHADISYTKEKLKWKPKYSIEEWLNKTIEHFKFMNSINERFN